MPEREAKAHFIDPMLLLKTETLPEGADILYEIKLDGFRSIAFKTGSKVRLRSRNDNDFEKPWFWRRLNEGLPSASSATTSPSMTVSSGMAWSAFAMDGYREAPKPRSSSTPST
jgi:hypothetical protein